MYIKNELKINPLRI